MWSSGAKVLPLLLLSALPACVLGGDVLKTTGFSSCLKNPTVKVKTLDVTYDRNTRRLSFDIAGESEAEQKVQAKMIVSAYGQEIYTKDFDPCDTGMDEICPGKC